TACVSTRYEVIGCDVGQHREARIEQRHFDMLATTSLSGRVQCSEDHVAREPPGADVEDRDAVLHRLALRVTANAHETRLGLQYEVVTGKTCFGSRRTVSRNRAPNDTRRVFLEPLVAETPFFEGTDLEVLDEH